MIPPCILSPKSYPSRRIRRVLLEKVSAVLALTFPRIPDLRVTISQAPVVGDSSEIHRAITIL